MSNFCHFSGGIKPFIPLGYAPLVTLLPTYLPLFAVITHRRSVAKRGGCFQRRLFVCQFVSVFVRTITSERLNIYRMMKLGAVGG